MDRQESVTLMWLPFWRWKTKPSFTLTASRPEMTGRWPSSGDADLDDIGGGNGSILRSTYFDSSLDRFPDIFKRLFSGSSLRGASWKRRAFGHNIAVFPRAQRFNPGFRV